MRLQEILNQNVSSLHSLRDEVALEMIEAKGKKFKVLQDKLANIEEAIFLKESGYEENNQKAQESV